MDEKLEKKWMDLISEYYDDALGTVDWEDFFGDFQEVLDLNYDLQLWALAVKDVDAPDLLEYYGVEGTLSYDLPRLVAVGMFEMFKKRVVW